MKYLATRYCALCNKQCATEHLEESLSPAVMAVVHSVLNSELPVIRLRDDYSRTEYRNFVNYLRSCLQRWEAPIPPPDNSDLI